MAPGEPQHLYDYYKATEVAPTYAALRGDDDLDRYARQRARLFNEILHLPPRLFAAADVAEFGPDTGENALVFARWGAYLTLVEPNPRAWPAIRAYFDRFGLSHRVVEEAEADVAGFHTDRTFDLVNAEGFIYTVKPDALWMDRFAALLKPGGHLLISYYERSAGLPELLWRAVFAEVKRRTGRADDDVARALFAAKWDTIPHSRSFDSWTMDVLQNPFVRREYFLDAEDLCRQLAARALRLYSSWPRYDDESRIHWQKQPISATAALDRQADHIARSRLGFAFGRKLYLTGPNREVAETADALELLIAAIDGVIDGATATGLSAARDSLAAIGRTLSGGAVLAESGAVTEIIGVIEAIEGLLDAIGDGDMESVATLCNKPDLIGFWGLPAHLSVFERSPGKTPD